MRPCSTKSNRISEILDWGSEQCHKISSSPRLDAEILLTYSLNKPRSYCRTWPEKALTESEIEQFEQLIQLRLLPTPVAYIVGFKEFWSRDFVVSSDTLVPRPETELLIEKALDFLALTEKPLQILDLGTGTGCIAITLKLEHLNNHVTAVDYYQGALDIAKQNGEKHHADITWLKSSWFKAVPQQGFDLIVSNPPYVASDDQHLSSGDLPAEPITALASGQSGLEDLFEITQTAVDFLNPNGMLLLEHGYNQRHDVNKLLKQAGYSHIEQYNDLAGQARISSGIKKRLKP